MKLVFVHGFLGNSLNWLPIVRKLESRIEELRQIFGDIQMMSVDLLGHGKKSDLSANENFGHKDIVKDLEAEIGSGEFIGVGHSFGLRPLLLLNELKRPHLKMRGLVVEDSSPVLSEKGFHDLKIIFDELPSEYGSRKLAKEYFEGVWGTASKMPGFLLTNLIEKQGVFIWRFDSKKPKALLEESKATPLWDSWGAFLGPVSMIFGGASSFVDEHRRVECVERRKGLLTRQFVLEGAGHWVHADQPDPFCDCLIESLKLIMSK